LAVRDLWYLHDRYCNRLLGLEEIKMNDNKLKRLLFTAFDKVTALNEKVSWQFDYAPYRLNEYRSLHEAWMLDDSLRKVKKNKPQLARKIALVYRYAVCSYFAFELYETIGDAAVILMKKHGIDPSHLDDPYFNFLHEIQYKYDRGVAVYILDQKVEAYTPHINIDLVIKDKAYFTYQEMSDVIKNFFYEQINALASFIQSWLGNSLDEMSLVKIVRAACIVIMSKHSDVIDFEGYGLEHCRRMIQKYINGGLSLSRNIAIVIERYAASELPSEKELINQFLRQATPYPHTNIVKVNSAGSTNWLAPGKGGAISDKSVDSYTFGIGDTPLCDAVAAVSSSDPTDRSGKYMRTGFRLALQKKG